eukprot:3900465-Amphidinium_carterae.2
MTVGLADVDLRVAACPGQSSCSMFLASFIPAALAFEASLARTVGSLTPPSMHPSKCLAVEPALEVLGWDEEHIQTTAKSSPPARARSTNLQE